LTWSSAFSSPWSRTAVCFHLDLPSTPERSAFHFSPMALCTGRERMPLETLVLADTKRGKQSLSIAFQPSSSAACLAPHRLGVRESCKCIRHSGRCTGAWQLGTRSAVAPATNWNDAIWLPCAACLLPHQQCMRKLEVCVRVLRSGGLWTPLYRRRAANCGTPQRACFGNRMLSARWSSSSLET
jgi:hypothetical protein